MHLEVNSLCQLCNNKIVNNLADGNITQNQINRTTQIFLQQKTQINYTRSL